MTILHLDSGREMRGGQWQVLRLVEGLRAAGHQITLLARTDAPLAEAACAAGVDVRPLNLATLVSLAAEADIVHAHDGRSHTLAAGLAAKHLVVSRRVAFPVQRNPASRWKYRRAAHFIAVSEFVKAVLREGGVPAGKISVVYDGVPAQQLSRRAGPIVIPDLADAGKGSALALAAAELAGVKAARSRDLPKDLAEASAMVYLTRSEGLGSAVLLAMAAGVPVIASNVGGLTENSVEAVASAILRLRDDPQLAGAIAQRARQMVEERFAAGRMVTETIAVYDAVAGAGSGRKR
jgi:glycosyltransferase involved in cell wall biosynthesis